MAADLSNAMEVKNTLNVPVEVQVYGKVTGTIYCGPDRLEPGETRVMDWGNSWFNSGKTVYARTIGGEWQNLYGLNVDSKYVLGGEASAIKSYTVVDDALENQNTVDLKNGFNVRAEVQIVGNLTGTMYCEPTPIEPYERKAICWGDASSWFNGAKCLYVRVGGGEWQDQPSLVVGSSYLICGSTDSITCEERITYESTLDDISTNSSTVRAHPTEDQVCAITSEYVYNMREPEHRQLPQSLRRHYEIVLKFSSDFDDHFVAIRPKNNMKKLYIAFQGTSSVMNALTDVCVAPNQIVKFNEVGMTLEVHAGIGRAVVNCLKQLIPLCDEMESVIVSGHSLGGGMATLFTSYLLGKYGNSKTLRCVAYAGPQVFATTEGNGNPRTFTGQDKKIFDGMNKICTNYVCGLDCVPRSPLLITTSSAKHVLGLLVSNMTRDGASNRVTYCQKISRKIHQPWKKMVGDDVYSPIEVAGLVLWSIEDGVQKMIGKFAGDGAAAALRDSLLRECENSKMFESYFTVGNYVVFDPESKKYWDFTQSEANTFCTTNILRSGVQCTRENIYNQVLHHRMLNYIQHFTEDQGEN